MTTTREERKALAERMMEGGLERQYGPRGGLTATVGPALAERVPEAESLAALKAKLYALKKRS